ncbi:transcription antiterminator LicT [Niallia circulans]|uniref:BglG family transcription antiterminator LicT n=1 Tax=Niallia circulans TaxID=1397 RepID=UPI000BA5B79D|nr:PRD domain-containing protein [Niallia circulans]PAD23183.1 transcription antiterminator LicT [Niallia circulans]PAD85373.1 transcription antiterminator LicT [Niallia circulans]
MKVIKVFNNNIISVVNNQNKELMIMGRGIGFQVKPGDLVNKKKIEKIYTLDSKEVSEKFKTLLREVPIEVMEVCEEIILYAKTVYHKKLNDIIYVALTDHINFAIQRKKDGYEIKNALMWETKKLYKDEFAIGMEAIKMIKERLGIELPEDEAGFIALHILNAELNDDITNIMSITKVIQELLTIVKYHFKIDFDEESLNYFRFITHLKFFAQRMLTRTYMDNDDDDLFNIVKEKHPKAFSCSVKINDYLKKEYHYAPTNEELLYLTIHIERVCQR